LSNIEGLNEVTDIKERKEIIKTYIDEIILEWDESSKQHTIKMSFKLPLIEDSISYKKGSSGRYLRDRKGFKKYEITDGEKELITRYSLCNSFDRHTFSQVAGHIHIAPAEDG